MEEIGGTFQVRFAKEFVPNKGRDKMLSLSIFASLPQPGSAAVEDDDLSMSANHSRSGNAYEFMQRRRRATGDPTTQRQHALIRLANFCNSDNALCVIAVWWICIEGFADTDLGDSFLP